MTEAFIHGTHLDGSKLLYNLLTLYEPRSLELLCDALVVFILQDIDKQVSTLNPAIRPLENQKRIDMNPNTTLHTMGLFSNEGTSPASVIPPALKLTSWEDMCEEGGGGTLIIFILLLLIYLVTHHFIFISGGEPLHNVTSPLYEHNLGRTNQSRFRRFMLTFEKRFVLPFVPTQLDSFVMWIFMWHFVITIPMGITRYYEGRWAHDFITLQGPLNLISYAFGCGTLNLTAIP